MNFSFLKLLALNKPEWVYILFGCLTSIINGGMEPAFALILSKLVSVSHLYFRLVYIILNRS
jgi:ATP-binding cassette subfamily B (MDR/TAP) protein 1